MGQVESSESKVNYRLLNKEEVNQLSPNIYKNIEDYKDKKNIDVFVIETEKEKKVIGIGCLMMKLTKKKRYGFVGIIKDIVIHSKDDNMSHNLIGHIAEYAIENGCYGCTMDELVE
tara:strand:- start:415 stop:762 length:348 start_codon:yes stop_codon:yes gene_type:complete